MRFVHRVTPDQDGMALRTLLKRELRFSTAMVQKLKATDGVRAGGTVLRVYQRVSAGMEVEILLPPELPTDAPVERGPLRILYEDDALLAVEKPPGVLTHPSLKQHYGTLVSLALGHVASHAAPVPAPHESAGTVRSVDAPFPPKARHWWTPSEAPTLHPLHRLDRDTSGIVVFAKHAHVQGHWMEQLKAGQVEKEYLGLVLGRMPADSGSIDLPIGRAPDSWLTRRIDPEGLSAHTEYRMLRTFEAEGHSISEVLLQPITGRTHQLRLHCLAVGAPLLGDTQYDTEVSRALSEAWNLSGQLLHAWRLAFYHPFTGGRLEITCPMTRHSGTPALRAAGGSLSHSGPP